MVDFVDPKERNGSKITGLTIETLATYLQYVIAVSFFLLSSPCFYTKGPFLKATKTLSPPCKMEIDINTVQNFEKEETNGAFDPRLWVK